MSGILNSGKLATLLSRLTSTRAGYLDNLSNLDASISGQLAAGGYTSARAAKLDNLDAAITTVGSTPPTSVVGHVLHSDIYLAGNPLGNASATVGAVQNTWYPLLSVTDSGVIEFLSIYEDATGVEDYQARLLVDGSEVWLSSTTLWSGDRDGDGVAVVGGAFVSGVALQSVAFGALPFSASFVLQARCTSAAAGISFRCRYRYYTT